MELIEVILSKENLNRAYKKVVANKGASGVDLIYRHQSEEDTFRKTMVRKDHWEYRRHSTGLSSRQ